LVCCPGVVSSQKVHVKPHVCVQVTLVPRREVERAVKRCVKTYKDSRLLCREVDMCVLSSSNHNHTQHQHPSSARKRKVQEARASKILIW
jgi:phage gpG-like protein